MLLLKEMLEVERYVKRFECLSGSCLPNFHQSRRSIYRLVNCKGTLTETKITIVNCRDPISKPHSTLGKFVALT